MPAPIEACCERAEWQRQGADALAADQDDDDQQQANPKRPVLRGQRREIVLHQLEQDGADQPAVEIAGTADDEDQKQVGGAFEVEDR